MIFVCHTAYHVYVALLKCFTQNLDDSKILLMDNIPDVYALAQRLENERIFTQVKALSHKDVAPSFTKRSFHACYVALKLMPWRAKKELGYLLEEDVYLFTDYSNVGAYLLQNKKQYHLLEDGCNAYGFDQHCGPKGKAHKAKDFLFRKFGIPYAMAMSDLCQDLEVNDLKAVITQLNCPVHERSRNEMAAALTQEQIDALLRVFAVDISMETDKKRLLLITQPLVEMYVVDAQQEAVAYYEKKIAQYRQEYQIYVKPHPRDGADYSVMFDGQVTVIDRLVPLEILNYKKAVQFDLAVSLNSTSVNGIRFCKEIRSL